MVLKRHIMKRIKGYVAVLIALFCLATVIRADELKVQDFYEDTGDLSGSFVPNQRKDMNGEVCALVKVVLPLEGAAFEGNVVGDVEFKAGEYWVYMTPGTKMLRIKHKTAYPTMIEFRDYGIPALESKTTYFLNISTPEIRTADVLFKVSPKESRLMVDNKEYALHNGSATIPLTIGEHTYLAIASGYDIETQTVVVNPSSTNKVIIELEAKEQNVATPQMAQPQVSSESVPEYSFGNDRNIKWTIRIDNSNPNQPLIKATAKIAKGYRLYAQDQPDYFQPLTFTLLYNNNPYEIEPIGDFVADKAYYNEFDDIFDVPVHYFVDTVTFTQRLRMLSPDWSIGVGIKGEVEDDRGNYKFDDFHEFHISN